VLEVDARNTEGCLLCRHGRVTRCCCPGRIRPPHVVFRRYPVFILVRIRPMQSATRRLHHKFHQLVEWTLTPLLRLVLPSAALSPVYVLAVGRRLWSAWISLSIKHDAKCETIYCIKLSFLNCRFCQTSVFSVFPNYGGLLTGFSRCDFCVAEVTTSWHSVCWIIIAIIIV